MSIYVIGINHKTASVAIREKAYFALDKISLYLQDLLENNLAEEAVILSTCNRSELYCKTDQIQTVLTWFAAQTSLTQEELDAAIYTYRQENAIQHMMQVASGLDSMVLGESQILGQMKEAFSESCTAGAVGTLFHRLFQMIFSVAKEIRTTTAIGACPVSVASAAIHFAKTCITDFEHKNLLLIGAGDTAQLLLRYLHSKNQTITIVNRDLEKALNLAKQFNVSGECLDHLPILLKNADVVFTATGSPLPIIKKEMLVDVMQDRVQRKLVFIDIAVPRDVESNVTEIDNVILHCIDDLKSIIEQNKQGRAHAADKAQQMIYQKSAAFMNEIKSMDKVAHTIRAYRNQIETLCRAELIKAKQQLHLGKNANDVLDSFSHALVKKLLHTPSVQLRQAAVDGQADLLQLAKQLFAISDHDERV